MIMINVVTKNVLSIKKNQDFNFLLDGIFRIDKISTRDLF